VAAILQTNSGTFDGTSIAVSLASSPATTSKVVLFISANTTVTTTGWTVRDSQVNFMGTYLLEQAGDGSTKTWTIPAAAGQGMWFVCEIANATYLTKTNNPSTLDTGSTASTAIPFTAVTPTAGARVIIAGSRGIIGTSGSPATYSGWAGGFTEVADTGTATGDRPSGAIATLEVTADGTTAYTPGAAVVASAAQQARSSIIAVYSTSAGGGTSYTSNPADPVGVTDSAATVVAAVRSQADPVGVTDGVVASFGTATTVGDPVGVTDAVSVVQARTIALGDNVGISDTGAPQAIDLGIDLADSVGVTDSTARDVAAVRPITDPVGVTDNTNAAGTGTSTANPADPVGVTDVASTVVSAQRPDDDPLGVTDTASASLVMPRTQDDPVGVTDSVSASLVASGSVVVADPVGVGDTATAVLVRNTTVTIGDAVGVTDAATRASQLARAVADLVGITDVVGLLNFSGTPETPTERIHAVSAESRVYVVASENRTA
jgi:hypothetical protein